MSVVRHEPLQFEMRLTQERTNAGLTAARARGRLGGRPPMSLDDPRIRLNTAPLPALPPFCSGPYSVFPDKIGPSLGTPPSPVPECRTVKPVPSVLC
jgi:hypothetical protein